MSIEFPHIFGEKKHLEFLRIPHLWCHDLDQRRFPSQRTTWWLVWWLVRDGCRVSMYIWYDTHIHISYNKHITVQYLTCIYTCAHFDSYLILSLHISYKWVWVAKSLSLHSLEYLVISPKYSEPRVTQLSPDKFYGRCLGAWTWRNCFTLFHDFPRKKMEV